MRRNEKETGQTFEKAVEQAASEWLDKVAAPMKANPGMKLIDLVPSEAMSLWFVYALIVETKKLKWLTVGLIILTAILALLTLRLALV